jgi:hypothetical protein
MQLTATMRQNARREQRAAEQPAAVRTAHSGDNGTDGRYFEKNGHY